MPAYRLLPTCKDYLWGGQRLKSEFNIQSDLEPLAEAWVLSCHPKGPSILADGPFAGKSLPDYLSEVGFGVLGTNCKHFRDFPILVKLIDAKEDLSIQIHPPDSYALVHEGQYGKTEMWITLEAEPDAFLYYGFQKEISRNEFAERISDRTLLDVLKKVPVQAGDVLFIPPGTVHGIGRGVVVAEIQQNSDVTYRIYDYNRMGKDGKPRPLHISKALDVADLCPVKVKQNLEPHLCRCSYFTVDSYTGPVTKQCGEESFHALLITDGKGSLLCGEGEKAIQKGNCFFLPAGSGIYQVIGKCKILDIWC